MSHFTTKIITFSKIQNFNTKITGNLKNQLNMMMFYLSTCLDKKIYIKTHHDHALNTSGARNNEKEEEAGRIRTRWGEA